jgi:hypothetical protein
MNHLKIVGFGCFGKPETVARMLAKKLSVFISEKGFRSEMNSIYGFYLGLDDKVLNLRVLSKRSGQNRVIDNFPLICRH